RPPFGGDQQHTSNQPIGIGAAGLLLVLLKVESDRTLARDALDRRDPRPERIGEPREVLSRVCEVAIRLGPARTEHGEAATPRGNRWRVRRERCLDLAGLLGELIDVRRRQEVEPVVLARDVAARPRAIRHMTDMAWLSPLRSPRYRDSIETVFLEQGDARHVD